MPKQFILILSLVYVLCSCNQKKDTSNYRVVFKHEKWLSVDLKSKILKVDYDSLKYSDTLKFTDLENKQLSDAISSVIDSKGSFTYYPNYPVDMPTLNYTIEIFKNDKRVSDIEINFKCLADGNPFSPRYQAIHLRDIILIILKSHKEYDRALTRQGKYMSDHGFFNL